MCRKNWKYILYKALAVIEPIITVQQCIHKPIPIILFNKLGLDRYTGLPIYFADTDTDILVSTNWIWVLAYRFRLSARWILAISIAAKYQLKSLDITQNIGIYRHVCA